MISTRLILWLSAVFIGVGLGLTVAGQPLLGLIALGVGVASLCAGLIKDHLFTVRSRPDEPEQIQLLDEGRRIELIRGTSMHLRDMKYRYSIRSDRSEREPFTAEVNTVILGFVPVIILDNSSEKQGAGYVAFPFDGERWRGPGLPCAGNRAAAIEHAAKCVAPLDEE